MLAGVLLGGGAVVLSGAGLSTESGIPDYRGVTGRARRSQPMTYQEFTRSAAARQRYWARSHLGWRHIAAAEPNAGHRAVAELERRGLLAGVITQNVDGLHQEAGARNITELHGSLYRVLKPDVVFFGENVPKQRVEECYAMVSAARALVVLGSSLTVMSGFRYVRHAASLGTPVVIVNQGATRGDDLAAATLDAPLGATLSAVLSRAPSA